MPGVGNQSSSGSSSRCTAILASAHRDSFLISPATPTMTITIGRPKSPPSAMAYRRPPPVKTHLPVACAMKPYPIAIAATKSKPFGVKSQSQKRTTALRGVLAHFSPRRIPRNAEYSRNGPQRISAITHAHPGTLSPSAQSIVQLSRRVVATSRVGRTAPETSAYGLSPVIDFSTVREISHEKIDTFAFVAQSVEVRSGHECD